MLPTCIRTVYKTKFNSKILIQALNLKSSYGTEASFETEAFKLHNLSDGPSTTSSINRDESLKLYKQLTTIRQMETAAHDLYNKKIVRGFCHLYSGQEAVAVGIRSIMRPYDAVITTYRAHGWTYLMGIDIKGIFGELTGRPSGNSRGKGGSMHMYSKNFYGGNGIVGAQVPMGVGIALALKYKNTDGVCVAVYGDGAANQGQIFEAYNMARLWNIPVIFVCENNGYGMGTSTERASFNNNFYTRCDYIPGIWVDGMDILAVREATKYAIYHCKKGNGPILLEAFTYKYVGPSMANPIINYRPKSEIERVKQTRDPIVSFKKRIVSKNLVTLAELQKIESDATEVVKKAVKETLEAKETSPDELSADVYCNNWEKYIRNVTPLNPLPHKHISLN